MKITGTEKLSHPGRLVFETLRDRTPALVEIMPNIESVEVLDREEEPPVVRLYNRWQGAMSDVPSVVRPFVSKDLVAWFDRAAWNLDDLACTWQIEAVVGREAFSCAGTTAIIPQGDEACTFKLEGEMQIDPDKVPGVPRFLARKLKEPFERFIAKAMSPNLTSIAGAVQKYLDSRRA
jgi:hypothetical protein